MIKVKNFQMATHQFRRYAGWAALLAGSLEIVGIVFLILFFAVELPEGYSSTLRFGYLSDVTPILVAPINLILMVIIFLFQRKQALGWSILAVIFGMAGILLTAGTNIMFVLDKISLEQQVQRFYISLAFLGPWHILVNSLARHDGSLPSGLTIFGIIVGIGQVMMYMGSFLLGSYDDLVSSSSTAVMTNMSLLLSLAIGIPLALVGYLGAPIWLVWLGQSLIRKDSRKQSG
jgi:hypothetical protein